MWNPCDSDILKYTAQHQGAGNYDGLGSYWCGSVYPSSDVLRASLTPNLNMI